MEALLGYLFNKESVMVPINHEKQSLAYLNLQFSINSMAEVFLTVLSGGDSLSTCKSISENESNCWKTVKIWEGGHS